MDHSSIPDAAETLSKNMNVEQLTEAQDGTAQEHYLGLFEALRLYPTAVCWSLIMSTAVIMEGYDTKLIGTLFAQPAFQKSYGIEVKATSATTTASYQISAPWQAGLSNGTAIGQLVGLLLAGYISERFGFRKTMLLGLAVAVVLIFPIFFAPNLLVLTIGEILFGKCLLLSSASPRLGLLTLVSGVPLGLFQTTPVIYAHEVLPLCLRPYLTNYVNFCWAFGQILATGILRGLLNRSDQWAYRIAFAVQWAWPIILIPIIWFAPESPWWLVRRGRQEEARKVVERLASGKNVDFDVDKNIALMAITTQHERQVNAATSYQACFQSVNRRRTLIVVGIYVIQNANGNPIRGYSTYFLEQAGLATTQAFNLSIVGFAVAILGGFFSWALLPLFGRRTIYFWSLVMMFFLMLIIGALGIPQAETPKSSSAWVIGSLLIVSSFLYNCSIGPLTNTLCSEIPSSLLRTKSIVLARWVYTFSNIIAGVLTPYMLNPTAWNWGAKIGFFYAGGCLLSLTFAFFWVPEPKGRTTAEMDILFERKVPPRHFSRTSVNLVSAVSIQVDNEEKS